MLFQLEWRAGLMGCRISGLPLELLPVWSRGGTLERMNWPVPGHSPVCRNTSSVRLKHKRTTCNNLLEVQSFSLQENITTASRTIIVAVMIIITKCTGTIKVEKSSSQRAFTFLQRLHSKGSRQETVRLSGRDRTAPVKALPLSRSTICVPTSWPQRACASRVLAPRCGQLITWEWSTKARFVGGSCENVSGGGGLCQLGQQWTQWCMCFYFGIITSAHLRISPKKVSFLFF